MQWIVPQGLTIKTLWAKTSSGTCTIRIKSDTTELHAGYNVTSTLTSTPTFAVTTTTAGKLITLDVTAAATAVDLFVLLECMVTSNA